MKKKTPIINVEHLHKPLSREQIRDKIFETNLEIKYQFLLALDKKLVGFERHLYYEHTTSKRIDITDTVPQVEGKKVRRKYRTEYEKDSLIVIVHKTISVVMFSLPFRWGRGTTDDKSTVVDSYVSPVYGLGGTIFRCMKHNRKVLITNKNIDLIVDNIYRIMKKWRWDLVGTYWSAFPDVEGRLIEIGGVDGEYAYSTGEYNSEFEIKDIEKTWCKITKEQYFKEQNGEA